MIYVPIDLTFICLEVQWHHEKSMRKQKKKTFEIRYYQTRGQPGTSGCCPGVADALEEGLRGKREGRESSGVGVSDDRVLGMGDG